MDKNSMETLIFGGVLSPPRINQCAFRNPPCKKAGYLVELSQLIAERMGFGFRVLAPLSGGWGRYNGSKWSGLIGDVTSGRVNLSLPVFLLSQNGDAIDFTQPVVTDQLAFFVNKDSERNQLDFLWWTIFDKWTWLGIAVVLALLLILRTDGLPYVHDSFRRFASHVSWVNFFQSVLLLLCAGIVSSGILEYLFNVPVIPFDSMEGARAALKNGRYRLALRFWDDELAERFHGAVDKNNVLINKDFSKLLDTISATRSNYFSYDLEKSAVKLLTSFSDVRMISATDRFSSQILFVIYMSDLFPLHLRYQVRSIIHSLKMLGHIDHIERTYLYTPRPIQDQIGWIPLTLFSCRYMFLGWFCGIIICLAVFIGEIIKFKSKQDISLVIKNITTNRKKTNYSSDN